MGLFRLLFWMVLLYLAYRVFGTLFQPRRRGTEVGGRTQSPSIDLSKKDVEDVDFKESPR